MRILRRSGSAALLGLLLTMNFTDAQDWTSYGFDQGGSRFSPLKQIDRSNVHQRH
jgi:glucose dehydrogenase